MWLKKHKWKIVIPVLVVAVLAGVFYYGGNAPGARGWSVEKSPAPTGEALASIADTTETAPTESPEQEINPAATETPEPSESIPPTENPEQTVAQTANPEQTAEQTDTPKPTPPPHNLCSSADEYPEFEQ